MTDVPIGATTVPARLGVTARFADDGGLILDLTPQAETLHHGIVRASVVSFIVDAVSGISVDGDASVWTLTTDMSIRMRPIAAPPKLIAVNTILRQGRRSVSCLVDVTTDEGAPIATGAVGFVNITRKDTDPPKPVFTAERVPAIFQSLARLTRPLREEAGIEVIDAAEGIVQIPVTPAVCNPAGTLQGAMVALVAECATEDLVSTRFDAPMIVTELDIRYLAKSSSGPVRSRCRLLGDGPTDPVQVELIDMSTDQVTTLAYARAVSASRGRPS